MTTSTMLWLAIALLLQLVLAALVMLLWRRKAPAQAAAPARVTQLAPRVFAAAMAALYPRNSIHGRYDAPCVLVCGAPGSGKSDVLRAAGLEALEVLDGIDSGWWSNMDGTAFELPAAAWEADAGPWFDCLRLLEKHRDRRPLDAVVWVLPLSALKGGTAGTPALTASGARMCRKFYDILTRLGLQLPVYVVVSGCDEVPGFAAFAGQLPAALREQSLGWSNPYALGTAWRAAWAEQGLAALTRRLCRLISELGAQRDSGLSFDDVFLLPERLTVALAPLPSLLQQALRQNATMETFDLRGLYLSGRAAGDSGPALAADPFGPAPVTRPDTTPPAFCRQLFAQRIFAEFGLARLLRPKLNGMRSAHNYALWACAAVALVWLLCLPFSYHYALQQAQDLRAPLAGLKNAIVAADNPVHEDSTAAMLTELDGVQDWSPSSIFMPLSLCGWSGGVDEPIADILQTYYQHVLFKNIDEALAKRKHELSASALPPSSAIQTAVATPELMPEFVSLNKFVDDTVEFEFQRNKFYLLIQDRQGRWADTAGLLSYLFKLNLSVHSPASSRLFDDILHANTYHRRHGQTAAQDQARFGQRLAALHEAWLDRLFNHNRLSELSTQLANSVEDLSHDKLNEKQALSRLQGAIADLRTLLTRTNLTWMADGNLYLGAEQQKMEDKIKKSALLGASAAATLHRNAIAAQEKFHAKVEQEASGEHAVLDYSQGKHLLINAEVTELENALGMLLQHGFAQGRPSNAAIAPDGSALISWNPEQLEAAQSIYQDSLAYETKELVKAPVRFQNTLKKIARLQAGGLIDHDLALATSQAARGTDWRVVNFDQARQLVGPLIAALRKIEQPALAASWQAVMDRQAEHLLQLLKAEFDAGTLYLPDETAIAAWDGRRLAAQRAYGASLPADLQDYLASQYSMVSELVDASKGPRAWLELPAAGQARPQVPELAGWRKLETELTKYAAKSPAGSLRRLEQMIAEDLNDIDSSNCGERLGRLPRPREPDFFQRRGQRVLSLFALRCAALQGDATRSAHRAIADFYNSALLNRYPFTQAADAPTAEPEQVRYLLRLLDVHFGIAREGLARQLDDGTGPALAFLDKLGGTRAMLSALLAVDTVSGGAAALDLWPEFRINRGREKGADQIIDWSIEAGAAIPATAARSGGLSWRLGEPIKVSLRWAKNSELAPAPDPARRTGMEVDAKQAIWRYTGQWALLQMLNEHAAPASELSERDAQAPQALRFIVPTRFGSGAPSADAIAFGRLGISLHGKPERLALPQFPGSVAPPLPAAAVARQPALGAAH